MGQDDFAIESACSPPPDVVSISAGVDVQNSGDFAFTSFVFGAVELSTVEDAGVQAVDDQAAGLDSVFVSRVDGVSSFEVDFTDQGGLNTTLDSLNLIPDVKTGF